MVAGIIQARIGSTRLPGKVMMHIEQKPMLFHVIDRVKRCGLLDSIIIATTTNEEDAAIIDLAKNEKVGYFKGPQEDVLARFYLAAKECKADVIVRITADCPLLDPFRIDSVIARLQEEDCDYINPDRNFSLLPRGIRAEAFTFRALEKTYQQADKKSDREHVTTFMQKNKQLFKYGWLEGKSAYQKPELRFVVDEYADLCFIKEIYSRLYKAGSIVSLDEVFGLLEKEPSLVGINKHILQKEV